MADSKITACAKVPKELYDFSIQKYTKISVAIIAGLELLKDKDSIQNGVQNQNSILNSIPYQIDSIRDEEIQSGENSILKAENERLQEINEILMANIEELKKDKDTIQNLYNNYMLQMQTLINQKSIESPGGAKKPWWRFW
jgi:hypothetical protein